MTEILNANEGEIADELFQAREQNRAVNPALNSLPLDYDEALAIQLSVLSRCTTTGRAVGGWKVGWTSGVARADAAPSFRPFGFILRDRILRSPASIELSAIHERRIEPELCLILGKDLAGTNVTAREARLAVTAIAPAFEINEMRLLPTQNRHLFIADGLANWGIVVGTPCAVPRDLSPVSVDFRADHVSLSTGPAEGGIDDHFASLARLASTLARHGMHPKSGDCVITGAFSKFAVTKPARIDAHFTAIGSVSAIFH